MKKKWKVLGVSIIAAILFFWGNAESAEASAGKYVYLFSNGNYSVGNPYQESAKLAAVVRTKKSSLEQVKKEISYTNGTIKIKNLNEESLNVYGGKVIVEGFCNVKELKACQKTKIETISVGGIFDYDTKKGKKISIGKNVVEYQGAYYCPDQIIEASDISMEYRKNGAGNLGAKVKIPTNGGGKLSFTVNRNDIIDINQSGRFTVKKAGEAVVTINAAPAGPFKPASRTVKVKINQANQEVTVGSEFRKTYGNGVFNLGARTTGELGANGLRYSSSNTAVAAVTQSGNVVIKGAGTAYITVSAIASTNYKAAPAKRTAVIVAEANQIISSGTRYTKEYGDADFSLNAVSQQKGKITYSSSNTNVVKVSTSGKVSIAGTGSAKITVTAAPVKNYKRTSKEISIEVKKADQTIWVSDTSVRIYKGYPNVVLRVTYKGDSEWKCKPGNSAVVKCYKRIKSTKKSNGLIETTGELELKCLDYGTTMIKLYANSSKNCNSVVKEIRFVGAPKKTKIVSAVSTAKDKLKITWQKVDGVSGYELEYALKKDFSDKKSCTISGSSNVSKTLTKLASGKRYYIRIQTYKKANDSVAYSYYCAEKLSEKVK